MNVPLSLLLAAEIFSVFTRIDALPGWWRGSSSKSKYWNPPSSEKDHICSIGQCIQAWKCPESAVSNHYTDHCVHWNNGPMVCCVLNNNQSDDHLKEISNTSAHPKAVVEENSRTTSHSNEFFSENGLSTISKNNYWNRKSWDKPISVSSYCDILKNSGEQGRKSPTPNNTFRNTRTTISPVKYRTSNIRVVFPTESVRTSKRTSHPAYTTNSLKKTSDNRITKSWMTRSTTPSVVTASFSTKNTKRTTYEPKYNQTSNSKTPKSWDVRSSTMGPRAYTTKHSERTVPNREFNTKSWRRTTDYKSTKLWSIRSTTMSFIGTTVIPLFKPTRFPISGKSTENGKETTRTMFATTKRDNDKRQTSTLSTTRPQSSRPKTTNKPVDARSTRSSTRGYRITTPLPNVNTYLCGIRDERSGIDRDRRHYDDRYHAASSIPLGSRSLRGRQPYQRIVGGEEVEPYSWPWVAALYKVTSPAGNRFLSAGSLINENFALTAAHVFTPEDLRTASFFVMLGTHNAQDAVAQYLVSSILRHPQYENRYYYHDIALLRLERPVKFNQYVMPVCLPSPDAPLFRDRDLQGKNVTVMGWGDEEFGGKSSRVLKEATFPVVSRTFCNTSYLRVASNRFPRGITDDMLCAGDPNGGKDACQGDSGGPLTSIELGRYTQVGIVSFGYQCGDKEFPGVYTKVAPYLSWIAENTLRHRYYENSDYDYY